MGLRVSVITVVYNGASTIADTLDSVAQQSYPDIEHIVIDGASSDSTVEVVRRYPHISQLISEPDQGIYDAMNKGVAAATGDVIVLLNADDHYQHDDVVQLAVNALQDNQVDACYADLVYVKTNDVDIVTRYWTSQAHRPGLCFSGWMPAHPTLFMRRSVYDKVGLFNIALKYQADLEFCARVFEVHGTSSVYVPQIWVRMRMGGVTNGSLKTMLQGNWESYQALKRLGLRSGFFRYFGAKLLPKVMQYVRRPNQEAR